jgi:hypothetical protein
MGNHLSIISYTTHSYIKHVIQLVGQDFINGDQIQEEKNEMVDLQEHMHKMKHILKHNAGDESLKSYKFKIHLCLRGCLSNNYGYKIFLNSPKC